MTPPRLRNSTRRMRRSRRASGASCRSAWKKSVSCTAAHACRPKQGRGQTNDEAASCCYSSFGSPHLRIAGGGVPCDARLVRIGAWLLAEECAAKFLWRSPWNPLYVPEAKTELDIGVAAHLAVLEPERQADSIVLIDAGDYRTTKARETRDAARAAGKVPLLPYQLDIVCAIAGSIRSHPIASEAFASGEAEVTLIWHDRETGIPCKARPDYLPAHGRWIVDLKTALSANPRSWRDQAYRFGYHARAAWYLDGSAAV